MPMKRVEHSLLAFSYFQNKAKNNYILNIVWPFQNGSYMESLKGLVKELHLENKVFFRWWISLEDREEIRRNKVLLFPSYKEWYWLVVLEANVYGIPAIWYDVWWVRDSIKEWINGFRVGKHDFEAMWEKLYQILKDEGEYKQLVTSSYEHVKNHTTWEKNTDIFENIIKEVSRKYDRST
jgi:glycosyltransferase involved in cell wall biosynthesis